MVLSVKGGNVRPTDIRDLRGVLEREEETELAGFISLREPSQAMRNEAAEADRKIPFEYNGVRYDRIQFLTIREMLEEKREFPGAAGTADQAETSITSSPALVVGTPETTLQGETGLRLRLDPRVSRQARNPRDQ